MPGTSQSALLAVVNGDGSAELLIDDVLTQYDTTSIEDARRVIMDRAVEEAGRRGSPVHISVNEPDGVWPLIVHADGGVEPDEDFPETEFAEAEAEAGRETVAQPSEEPSAAAEAEVPPTRQEPDRPDEQEPTLPAQAPATPLTPQLAFEPVLSREPAPATASIPVSVDMPYDEDDDSDVVDDPAPETEQPTRRQHRGADPEPRPAAAFSSPAAPAPMPAAPSSTAASVAAPRVSEPRVSEPRVSELRASEPKPETMPVPIDHETDDEQAPADAVDAQPADEVRSASTPGAVEDHTPLRAHADTVAAQPSGAAFPASSSATGATAASTPQVAPAPRPAPAGGPAPSPAGAPRPGRAGAPKPGPAGVPKPGPAGAAKPAPADASQPAPEPAPVATPTPGSADTPQPGVSDASKPGPAVAAAHAPAATPTPTPVGSPEPASTPAPKPSAAEPAPAPARASAAAPAAAATTATEPTAAEPSAAQPTAEPATSEASEPDGLEVFAPLHSSPQTPATRRAEASRPRSAQAPATQAPDAPTPEAGAPSPAASAALAAPPSAPAAAATAAVATAAATAAAASAPASRSARAGKATPTPKKAPAAGTTESRATPPAQTRAEARRSFLTPERSEEPAEQGWRGVLAKAGVWIGPSAEERAERDDVFTVSQHWPGPRTIAIVNGKGGAGKTPTAILTAAVFARFGGAGVLAWDNNQTRGTLGWRTEQGPHEATLHDLLPETERLLSAEAQSADLAHFVHHQTRDRYDVLRSKPILLSHEQRIEKSDVDDIHAVAAKYYRLIIMDSGNDESDPMWRRMIDHTDQLVVATTTRAEHAEAGALLLEALAERYERSAKLVKNSVAVVSQADPHAPAAEVRNVVDGYRSLSRAAVTIPYDPAMAGGLLHYQALRPATRRAWLAATAAIAKGLGPEPA